MGEETIAQTAVQKEPTQPPSQSPPSVAPVTGRRSALDDLKIQLTPEELASTGAQKLLLEMLAQAKEECERLATVEDDFHVADKQVGVLTAQSKTNRANEVMFGGGVGFGCAIFGLAPFLWGLTPDGHLAAILALVLGGALTIIAVFVRIFLK